MLGIFLKAYSQPVRHRFIQKLSMAIEQQLELAGFDPEQIAIRLDRMSEDCENDLKESRHRRAWLKDHKTRLKRVQRGRAPDQALDA